MKKTILALFAFTCVYSIAGKYDPIYTGSVVLNGKTDLKEIGVAVRKALIGRGWQVTEMEKGEIHATLRVRSHVAKVKVTFNREQLSIEYVDSANLGYRVKGGIPYIHGNYNRWISLLERDISVLLI